MCGHQFWKCINISKIAKKFAAKEKTPVKRKLYSHNLKACRYTNLPLYHANHCTYIGGGFFVLRNCLCFLSKVFLESVWVMIRKCCSATIPKCPRGKLTCNANWCLRKVLLLQKKHVSLEIHSAMALVPHCDHGFHFETILSRGQSKTEISLSFFYIST